MVHTGRAQALRKLTAAGLDAQGQSRNAKSLHSLLDESAQAIPFLLQRNARILPRLTSFRVDVRVDG
jgi:hypothetical protein